MPRERAARRALQDPASAVRRAAQAPKLPYSISPATTGRFHPFFRDRIFLIHPPDFLSRGDLALAFAGRGSLDYAAVKTVFLT